MSNSISISLVLANTNAIIAHTNYHLVLYGGQATNTNTTTAMAKSNTTIANTETINAITNNHLVLYSGQTTN